MKITIPREALISALSDVSPVIPTKTPKDILKNVLLVVSGGTTTLIATDQEVGIRREIKDATAEHDGSVVLPPGRIMAILREVDDDSVELDIQENVIRIVSGSSSFKLSTVEASEFPDVHKFTEKSYFVVRSNSFKSAVGRTIFCCDTESTRFALGGIAFDFKQSTGAATFVATDSRRLAMVHISATKHGEAFAPEHVPVVPARAAKAMAAALPDDESEVSVAILPSAILMRFDGVTVYARLIEGRFPMYQQVIPSQKDITREMSTVVGPFHSAIRQAMITQNSESKGADFEFVDGELSIKSVAAEIGSSEIKLPIQWNGEPLSMTVDPKYISQFLSVIDRESQVVAKFVDGNSAALFESGDNYKYVVMPLARD